LKLLEDLPSLRLSTYERPTANKQFNDKLQLFSHSSLQFIVFHKQFYHIDHFHCKVNHTISNQMISFSDTVFILQILVRLFTLFAFDETFWGERKMRSSSCSSASPLDITQSMISAFLSHIPYKMYKNYSRKFLLIPSLFHYHSRFTE
jgi:hypothetical protein